MADSPLLPLYALLKMRRLDLSAIEDDELALIGFSRERAEWATNAIASENLYRELDSQLARRETVARLAAEYDLPLEYFEALQLEAAPEPHT